MASTVTLVTSRDRELFAALDCCPLTPRQLWKFSQSFVQPFTSERCVRERLGRLAAAGRVRRWLYATAGRGALSYFTLSPLGHQLLYGPDEAPRRKRAFRPVAVSLQAHTQALADFIAHTVVAARHAGVRFAGFYGENTLCLTVDGECLYPDCAFQLVTPDGRAFSFFAEVDNATEPVHSVTRVDAWQRRLKLYDALRNHYPTRFRVLVVTTGGPQRLEHILELAGRNARGAGVEGRLAYGVTLPTYLAEPQAVTAACFGDHRGQPVALIPQRGQVGSLPQRVAVTTAPEVAAVR